MRFGDTAPWLRVSFPAADGPPDADAGGSLLAPEHVRGRRADTLLPHVAFWHLVDTPCRLSRPQGNVRAACHMNWAPHAATHGLGWEAAVSTGRRRPSCVLSHPACGAELSSVLTPWVKGHGPHLWH